MEWVAGGRRYRIGDLIDGGGIGIIYMAEDAESGRRAIIKQYLYGKDEDGDFVDVSQHFLTSVRVHKSLDTRNGLFPEYYGSGKILYAMEYIEGKNLRTLQNQPEDVALATGYMMASCIEEFHKARIVKSRWWKRGKFIACVHRDIKPGNFIVRPDGRLVLIDFDCAWLGDDVPFIVGTAGYRSPEHITGEEPTPSTDIYSAGCSLYFLCGGKLKMEGPLANPILPEDISTIDGPDIKEVVEACLRIRKGFESAGHMRADIGGRLKRKKLKPEYAKDILLEFSGQKKC